MTYAKKMLFYFIAHTTIGFIALLFVLFGTLPDSYREGIIAGIAGGFIITGLLGIINSIRLLNNPKKAKEVEITKNEERTQLVRMKTHSAIFVVTLYTSCIATLLAGILGFKEVSITIAAFLIFQTALYVGFANYYWNKY